MTTKVIYPITKYSPGRNMEIIFNCLDNQTRSFLNSRLRIMRMDCGNFDHCMFLRESRPAKSEKLGSWQRKIRVFCAVWNVEIEGNIKTEEGAE